MNNFVTAIVDENFDVYQRLARMRGWQNEYFGEDDLPCLSPQLLEEAWKELQIERVENFF